MCKSHCRIQNKTPPPIFLIEMVSLKTFSSLSVCVYLCVCDVCQLDNGGPSAGSECVDNKSSRLNAGLITSQECWGGQMFSRDSPTWSAHLNRLPVGAFFFFRKTNSWKHFGAFEEVQLNISKIVFKQSLETVCFVDKILHLQPNSQQTKLRRVQYMCTPVSRWRVHDVLTW